MEQERKEESREKEKRNKKRRKGGKEQEKEMRGYNLNAIKPDVCSIESEAIYVLF